MPAKEVSVRVIGRFRPINKRETEEAKKRKWEEDDLRPCLISEDNMNVEIHVDQKNRPRFSLDYFLPENTTQATCFELVVLPIVKDNIQGINGTVFAYGQTGSGKTWSMFGPEGDPKSLVKMIDYLGLIPRAATTMFDVLEKSDRFVKYEIKLSVLEIYVRNELRDLLHPKKKGDKPLKIREGNKRIFVQGLKSTVVNSVTDVLKYIAVANKHRTVSTTMMNATSSRSHSIFTLQLWTKSRSGTELSSRISFCDLAGSEKVGKTGAAGKQLKEGMAINQSLTCLGQVITALVEHRKPSFRDTALTHVLKDSLVGNCKTTILVCLSPHRFNVMETINTLRFAARAKMIKNKFKVNKTKSPKEMMKEIKMKNEEIRLLKLQLQRQAMKAVAFTLPEQGTPYIRFFFSAKARANFANITVLETDCLEAIEKAKKKAKVEMLKTRLSIRDCDDKKEKSMEVLIYCDATSDYEKDQLTKARDQLHSFLIQEGGILKNSSKAELLFEAVGDDKKPGVSDEAYQRMVADIKRLKSELEQQKVERTAIDEVNKALRIENDKLKINVEHTDELYSNALFRIKDLEDQINAREGLVTELQSAFVRASSVRQDSISLLKQLDLSEFSGDEVPTEKRDTLRDTLRNENSLRIPHVKPSLTEEKSQSPSLGDRHEFHAQPLAQEIRRLSTMSALSRMMSTDRDRSTSVFSRKSFTDLFGEGSPEDVEAEVVSEAELKQMLNMLRLELKNLHSFFMDAKDMVDIEQTRSFYDESFKVVAKVTAEFTQQIGLARREVDYLNGQISDLQEKIATIENANEWYENELSAVRDALDTVLGRSSDQDQGFGGVSSLAEELGYEQRSGPVDIPLQRRSVASVIPLERDELSGHPTERSVVLLPNEDSERDIFKESSGGDTLSPMMNIHKKPNHNKMTTMSRAFSSSEKNVITELIFEQTKALKEDMHYLDDTLYLDYSSSEVEEEDETTELSLLVSDKAVIDWNLAEVTEFLNIIEKGQFRKFIPEFKRTLVTGEVLLSLQRTELKNEYSMNREEISLLFKSLFILDPNFKRRMESKYRKKKKTRKIAYNDQMIMSTVDWDSFISKQNLNFSWEFVDCCVGELVRLKDGREGRVLFKGPTQFGSGVWLGIELTKGEGLNDGRVKGVRYFKTHGAKYGIFIREQKVKEKLDMTMYQPPQLNRRVSSLDLAVSARSTSYNDSDLLIFGESGEDSEDMGRSEQKIEEDWYLSTSSDGAN